MPRRSNKSHVPWFTFHMTSWCPLRAVGTERWDSEAKVVSTAAYPGRCSQTVTPINRLFSVTRSHCEAPLRFARKWHVHQEAAAPQNRSISNTYTARMRHVSNGKNERPVCHKMAAVVKDEAEECVKATGSFYRDAEPSAINVARTAAIATFSTFCSGSVQHLCAVKLTLPHVSH